MKKILLVPNIPKWAFDYRADFLMTELGSEFHFTKMFPKELAKKPEAFFNQFDCIFFFFWQTRHFLKLDLPKEKLMTGIFSYNSWSDKKQTLARELLKYKTLVLPNEKMFELKFFKSKPIKKFYAPNGVETEIFYPKKKKHSGKKLVVGWAGNPNHENREYKGYWNIVLPVCRKNKDWIELKTAIQGKTALPHKKMRDFYNSIDVLVCASKNETGPNTLLEAGACQTAVVSTPVGLAEEILENGKNGILIKRNQTSLTKALKALHEDRKQLYNIAKSLRKTILNNWTTKHCAEFYKKAFIYTVK